MALIYNIREIEAKKGIKEFIKLGYKLYKSDKNWVAPLEVDLYKLLDKNIHPYHKHAKTRLFIVYKGMEPVGRIAGSINYLHNEFHNEKVGFFGFFDCIDNLEATELLFSTVEDWLRDEGMETVRGPANFSTNDTCGLLVEGFDSPPVILMPYNPSYYIKLIENSGYAKAMDLLAYKFDKNISPPEKLNRVINLLKKRGDVSIRELDKKNMSSEIKLIKDIYNDAWEKNWGFVPMTDEEFDFMAKELKPIVEPNLALIAYCKNEPAGFVLSLPDLNVALKKINGKLFPFGIFKLLYHMKIKRIRALRLITLGIKKKFRKTGIDAILYGSMITNGINSGYIDAEISWILENNDVMNNTIKSFGGNLYKKYRFYEKKL